ncbi:MAG: PucR family transcriptional regulator [Kineosporiaceae bacterium]
MTRPLGQRPRLSEESLHQLEWATGRLASEVVARMEAELPWFSALGADQRAAVGLIVQSGIRELVRWYRQYQAGDGALPPLRHADLFGTAPRQLTSTITLQQTVSLVRMAVDTCERRLETMLGDGLETPGAREMLLRYAREVAFSAAEVYARAAETRGAWDARLESLVVDAVVRGDGSDALASQASALSWDADRPTTVVVAEPDLAEASPALWRRTARDHDAEIITGRQGPRLVCLVGGPSDPLRLVRALLPLLGEGPVVVGPTSPGLAEAGRSARAALSGIAAARAWPEAPRPVLASALLPERVLADDDSARRELRECVYRPLVATGGDLLATVSAYLAHGGTLEATARQLFVHPNTVRYRLGRVAELTGLRPTDPRDRWTLQVAVGLGRLGPERGGE